MRNYQPTYEISETAENIRFFIEAHKHTFWSLLKPLLPYIVGLYFIDALITGFYYRSDPQKEFSGGAFLATYFYLVLMISWYRLTIIGVENFTPMNPLKPTRHEILYVLVSVILTIIFYIVSFLLDISMKPVGEEIKGLSFLLFLILFLYLAFKLSFYFPALAVNEYLSFSQSWRLTKGYFTRIVFSPLLASFKVLLMAVVYLMAAGALTMGIFYMIFSTMAPDGDIDKLLGSAIDKGINPIELLDKTIVSLLTFALYMPLWVYFQPLLMVFNATGLANYYMYVMQNRNDAVSSHDRH